MKHILYWKILGLLVISLKNRFIVYTLESHFCRLYIAFFPFLLTFVLVFFCPIFSLYI